MADNTEPAATATYDTRLSDSLTASGIAASTNKRNKIMVARDTEAVTVITETQKRDIPFGAEANTTSNSAGGVGIALTKVGTDLPMRSLTSSDGSVVFDELLETLDIKTAKNNLVEHLGYDASLVGDSNTIGYTGVNNSIATFLSDGTFATFKNFGVGGATTATILSSQVDDAIAATKQGGFILVDGGTNDTATSVPTATTKQNLESIYTQIMEAGRIAVPLSILPGAGGVYKTERDEINTWEGLESSARAYYLNFDFMGETDGSLSAVNDNGDGVHLNEVGMETKADYIKTSMELVNPLSLITKGDISDTSDTTFLPIDPSTWVNQVALEAWVTGVSAPDGSNTAYGMVADTTSTSHYVRGTSAGATVDVRHNHAFVKAGEVEWVKFLNSTTGSLCVYNMRTGAVYDDSGTYIDGFGIIPNIIDGWSFVWLKSSTSVLTGDKFLIQPYQDQFTGVYAGHGTNPEIYLWNPASSIEIKSPVNILESKLDGIEAGAEVNNISDTNATALTDGGETDLHSHAEVKNNLVGHDGFFATAIGDSNLIAEFTLSPWTFEYSRLSGYSVKNYALGGDDTEDIYNNQIQFAIEEGAKYCVVMGGTNDKGNTASWSIANLDKIYRELQSHGIIVVAIGILPGDSGTYKAIRDEINAWIENTSTADHYVSVDVFDDGTGDIKTEYKYNADHLNADGQDLLGQKVHAVNPIVSGTVYRANDPSDICDNNLVPIDPTAWTSQAKVSFTTGHLAPDDTNTAYGMVATTEDSAGHYVYHQVSGSLSAGTRYDGVWLKGNLSEYCRVWNNTTLAYATIKILTGGNFQADLTTGVTEDFGIIPGSGQADGWTLFWIKSTSIAANDTMFIYPSRTPDGESFSGDGTEPELYMWNPFKCESLKDVYSAYKECCDNTLAKNNEIPYIPTKAYHPVTKEYVDNAEVDASIIQGTSVIDNDTLSDGEFNQLTKRRFENLITNSENFNNWTLSAVTINDNTGIVASAATTSQRMSLVVDGLTVGVDYTIRVKAQSGNLDWFSIYPPYSPAVSVCFFDVTNGVIGSTPSTDAQDIVDNEDGTYDAYVKFTANTSSASIYMRVTNGDNDTNGTGDGSTVSIEMPEVQIIKGDIARSKQIKYIATTDTPDTGVLRYCTEPKNSLIEKTPTSATDTGVKGTIVGDEDYIYRCTATDTWKRVSIATW